MSSPASSSAIAVVPVQIEYDAAHDLGHRGGGRPQRARRRHHPRAAGHRGDGAGGGRDDRWWRPLVRANPARPAARRRRGRPPDRAGIAVLPEPRTRRPWARMGLAGDRPRTPAARRPGRRHDELAGRDQSASRGRRTTMAEPVRSVGGELRRPGAGSAGPAPARAASSRPACPVRARRSPARNRPGTGVAHGRGGGLVRRERRPWVVPAHPADHFCVRADVRRHLPSVRLADHQGRHGPNAGGPRRGADNTGRPHRNRPSGQLPLRPPTGECGPARPGARRGRRPCGGRTPEPSP